MSIPKTPKAPPEEASEEAGEEDTTEVPEAEIPDRPSTDDDREA